MSTTAATSTQTALTGASSAGTTSDSRNKLSSDMNMFLTLLTTQLKYQDPTNPMDSDKFTEQLVQYSQVEQQISTNEKLDSLVSLNGSSQAALAVQYIGMNIEAETNQLSLQDGAARFSYGLASDAKNVSVTISDSSGKTVYTTAGETTAGVHEVNWDGKDSNGNQLADGLYKVSATATDTSGASVDTWTTTFGKVDAVTTQDGQAMVISGKIGVLLSDVLSVTPPAANTSSSSSSASSSSSSSSTTDDSSS